MNSRRRIALQIFRWIYRLLATAIGQRRLRKLRPARLAYDFATLRLIARGDIALVNTEVGRMFLNIGSKHSVGWQLFLEGVYDKSETELFKRLVSEGMTVVDLGANIGYYTLLAAKLVGAEGKVFAFEPEARNYDVLVRNIEIGEYDNVVPLKKAVADRNGTVRLVLDQEDPGSHRIDPDSQLKGDSINVDVITIDSFFEDRQHPIDVIKMDIEGAEPLAIEGMAATISRNPNLKILTEFNPDRLQSLGFSPVQFLKELTQYGFALYTILSKEPWISPVSVAQVMQKCQDKGIQNLFCQKQML